MLGEELRRVGGKSLTRFLVWHFRSCKDGLILLVLIEVTVMVRVRVGSRVKARSFMHFGFDNDNVDSVRAYAYTST